MRLLVPLILPLLPMMAAAEKKTPEGVEVALVSRNTGIAAGTPFRVGLKIHHHPGFHTYWQNPGIAGVPTDLTWKLPEGFSAGPIQWPFPEKTMMAIHPVHGYERDVMLLVDITPPAVIRDTKVTLQATASWMACAKGCFPGSADLELILPVSQKPESDPAVRTAFVMAQEEIPSPLENWSVALLSAKDAKQIHFRLIPASKGTAAPENLYFFSSDGQVSSDQPQRVETAKDGSLTITLVRSEQSPKGKATLPGILESTVPWGTGGKSFASIEPAFSNDP